MTRWPGGQVIRVALAAVYDRRKLSSKDDDRYNLGFIPRARDPPRNPNHTDQRNYPRREKRDRYANHAQTPHQCAYALRDGVAKRRDEAGLGRNHISLAVNLDRDLGWRVFFGGVLVDLVVALHAQVFDCAKLVEGLHHCGVIFHWESQRDTCDFASIQVARER